MGIHRSHRGAPCAVEQGSTHPAVDLPKVAGDPGDPRVATAARRCPASGSPPSSASGRFGSQGAAVPIASQRRIERRAMFNEEACHSLAPAPGTTPPPTSNCARTALSRDAKRMSQASRSSQPWPRARPRSLAIEITRDWARRVTNFGHSSNGRHPAGRGLRRRGRCRNARRNSRGRRCRGRSLHLGVGVELKIRVSVVRFRPWPPSRIGSFRSHR